MTSVVKVQAHCGSNKEVQIIVHNPDGTILEKFTIQDGQTSERCVFDARLVTVNEVEKQA